MIERFKIRGMRDADCAKIIEKTVKAVSAVTEVKASFRSGILEVSADGPVPVEEVATRIAAAGYRIAPAANALGAGDSALDLEDPQTNLQWLVAGAIGTAIVVWLQHEPAPAFRIATLAVTTLVIVTAGLVFFRGALMAERNRTASMDTLVALGITSAYLFSIITTFPDRFLAGPRWFDTVAGVILFVRFGKFLEARMRRRARAALTSPLDFLSGKATIVRDGQEIEVQVSDLAAGDIVSVRPGERIPADGIVISGTSAIEEPIVSGEAPSVEKEKVTRVMGGALNVSAPLTIRTIAVGGEMALVNIVRSIEEAQDHKPPIQINADARAARMAAIAISAAFVAFAAWLWLSGGIPISITAMIAVLVIAAPGAIGQAAPVTLMAASAVGMREGILFKRSSGFESLNGVRAMVLDKSGTLTVGRPELETVVTMEGSTNEALAIAATAAVESTHPLSQAVMAVARERRVTPQNRAEDIREAAGMGIVAQFGGRRALLGNDQLMTRFGVPIEPHARDEWLQIAESGATPVFVALDRKIVAAFGFRDRIRPEARGAVAALRGMGMRVVMVSGDDTATAEFVARKLGIDEVHAHLMPAGKIRVIKHFQTEVGHTCMVGDGIQDAPALAAADLGIAIGTGIREIGVDADVALVRNDLYDVVRAAVLARSAMAKVRQNFSWINFYHAIAIPVAAGMLYPLVTIVPNPAAAALVMSLAGFAIVCNSLLFNVSGRMKLHAIEPELDIEPTLEDEPPDARVELHKDGPPIESAVLASEPEAEPEPLAAAKSK
ncbi:MAG TPA: cation-translocating P-type ATPase [Candidatus Binataceae bacterium]|nr:cation-translocating P-type ATPase [Candidatus Binataceae bacterium]